MKLSIVPTPIGNLGDMTYRAVEVLKSCSIILAEDTRTSGKLLKHYEINTSMQSYHMHNEHAVQEKLIERIKNGEHFALISDAGTPGISDPAYLLIRSCIQNEIEVECLPGAVAFVPALVSSGFPLDDFVFKGFPPAKKGRQTFFESLKNERRVVVLYESPHRILKTVQSIHDVLGSDTPLCLARELSKKFEEKLRGSAQALLEDIKKRAPKGELVLVINNRV